MTLPFDYSVFKTLLLVLASPPVPMLGLAAWGGWRLKRGRRGGGWMLGLALVALWLSATVGMGELLFRAVGRPAVLSPASVDALKGRTDGAVLVLGGGVTRHVPEFGAGAPKALTARRLAYGVWVARRSGWPLAFTGGIGWTARELRQPEAEIVSRVAAEDYGLPLRWAESSSRDTRENAANTLPVLARAGVKQVVLVTNAEHMRRSVRAFEAVAAPLGMTIVPAPVGLIEDGLSSFDDWVPSTSGMERVNYVIYETLAWWAGR